jgi:hypothetical protein
MTYTDYVARLQNRHGDKFSDADLSPEFAKFYGQRIEVRFSCGTVKRGFVSGTTGWRPSLMLMLRRNSSGSSWLLSDRDTVVRTFNEWR